MYIGGCLMAFTFNPLWKTLINKNMNKENLRKLINASPGTIAKLSKKIVLLLNSSKLLTDEMFKELVYEA